MTYYLSLPFKNGNCGESYPVGLLGDIKLHCLHYKTFEEAKEKWEKRTKRINYKKLVYIMTDQCGCTAEHFRRFMKVPGKKIFLTSNEIFKNNDCVVFMDSKEYIKKHNGRSLVDDAFLFTGFTGKRNYERYCSIEKLLKDM